MPRPDATNPEPVVAPDVEAVPAPIPASEAPPEAQPVPTDDPAAVVTQGAPELDDSIDRVVYMKHDGIEGVTDVLLSAFNGVWQARGWELADAPVDTGALVGENLAPAPPVAPAPPAGQ